MCWPIESCSRIMRFEYCVSAFPSSSFSLSTVSTVSCSPRFPFPCLPPPASPLILDIVIILLLVVLVFFSLCNSLFSPSVPRCPSFLLFALCPYHTENLPKTKQHMPTLPGFVLPRSKKIKHNASDHAQDQFQGSPCCVVVSSSSGVHSPSGCAHDPNVCYHTVHVCAINATSRNSRCCICVWRGCWLGRGLKTMKSWRFHL